MNKKIIISILCISLLIGSAYAVDIDDIYQVGSDLYQWYKSFENIVNGAESEAFDKGSDYMKDIYTSVDKYVYDLTNYLNSDSIEPSPYEFVSSNPLYAQYTIGDMYRDSTRLFDRYISGTMTNGSINGAFLKNYTTMGAHSFDPQSYFGFNELQGEKTWSLTFYDILTPSYSGFNWYYKGTGIDIRYVVQTSDQNAEVYIYFTDCTVTVGGQSVESGSLINADNGVLDVRLTKTVNTSNIAYPSYGDYLNNIECSVALSVDPIGQTEIIPPVSPMINPPSELQSSNPLNVDTYNKALKFINLINYNVYGGVTDDEVNEPYIDPIHVLDDHNDNNISILEFPLWFYNEFFQVLKNNYSDTWIIHIPEIEYEGVDLWQDHTYSLDAVDYLGLDIWYVCRMIIGTMLGLTIIFAMFKDVLGGSEKDVY